MAFPASGPLVSSRNSPVSLAIIYNFGDSVFSTKPMRLNSDGVGCGGESRSRSPTRSQAHSPTPNPAAVPQARLRYLHEDWLACYAERPGLAARV